MGNLHPLAEMQAKYRTPFLNCRLSPRFLGIGAKMSHCETGRTYRYAGHRSTPAAICQLLSARSYPPQLAITTSPPFMPLQLPANFSARGAVSLPLRGDWFPSADSSFPPVQLPANFSAQAANYTNLFKLMPTTKHFRFYLPHDPLVTNCPTVVFYACDLYIGASI